ncbi:MAG: hypothetical protein HY314_09190 [Acidobacteria bacterium]|nr:hypothetical protein [Acidobacteriota bacterium]
MQSSVRTASSRRKRGLKTRWSGRRRASALKPRCASASSARAVTSDDQRFWLVPCWATSRWSRITVSWKTNPEIRHDLANKEPADALSTGSCSSLPIRRRDRNGIITTVVGTGEPGFSGDGGPATAARLKNPSCIASDAAGNLYIADSRNSCILVL